MRAANLGKVRLGVWMAAAMLALAAARPGAADTVRYVWTNSPSPGNGFTNWTTAAHTIQAAVDASADNDTVWVTNGVYNSGGTVISGGVLTNRVHLSTHVFVRSVNGPSKTTIVGVGTIGPAAVRCALLEDGELDGFTLTNGATCATGDSVNDQSGGGALCSGVLNNCIVVGCRAARNGGGAYLWMGKLDNCTVTHCVAAGKGGGVYEDTDGQVSGCVLTGNRAAAGGGGYLYDGGRIDDSLVSGNTATNGNGGGVYSEYGYEYGSGGGLSGTTIQGNTSSGGGGGVYIDRMGGLDDCVVSGNTAGTNSAGGGAYLDGGGQLDSCLVVDNVAGGAGGGVYCNAGLNWGTEVAHCTIVGNAGAQAGGVYSYGVNGWHLLNSIVCSNTAPGGTNIAGINLDVVATCNPDVSGKGCFSADPQFIDADGGDYRLRSISPCIDAGSNDWQRSNFSLDGFTRILGGRVDMGAYESPEWLSITNPAFLGITVGTGTSVCIVGGTASTNSLAGVLTWTNQATGATGTVTPAAKWQVSGMALGYGRNLIVVRGTNASGQEAVDSTVYVRQSSVAYVATGAGNVAPYDTWAKAAAVIQNAVDTVVTGGTVWVSNGVYTAGGKANGSPATSNRVYVYKSVVLQSVNGPNVTTIQGAADPYTGGCGTNAVRCAYVSSGRLCGFSLEHGYTRADGGWNDQQGGGGALVVGGYVSNCIAAHCTAQHFGGGLDLFGGDAWNCMVVSNRTHADGGGMKIENSEAYNCLVRDNNADGNGGGVYFYNRGTLCHATVTGNRANGEGGGVYCYQGGTSVNTIVYFNDAVSGVGSNTVINGGGAFQYCCTTPSPGGPGIVVNPPAFTAPYICALRNVSPCIDVGTNLANTGCGLDGYPRPLDGNGDGVARADIGSCEFLVRSADSDGDGIPDGWELDHGFNPVDPADALTNPDADGFNNLQEYIADTDRTNPASYFRITAVSNLPPWTVYFVSSTARTYKLYGCTNLASGTWTNVPGAGPRAGAGGADSMHDTNWPAKGPFYRVKVNLP